jgi:hypothetical protein
MSMTDCLLGLADFGVNYIRGVDIIDRAVRSRRIDRSASILSLKWATVGDKNNNARRNS